MMLDQRGAALDPVAVIHIGNAVNIAHFRDMDMAANRAVKAFALAVIGDLFLETMDEIHRPFGAFLQAFGQ